MVIYPYIIPALLITELFLGIVLGVMISRTIGRRKLK